MDQSTTTITPPKNKFSILLPLFSILLILSLVISGYLFYQNQLLQKQIKTLTGTETPPPGSVACTMEAKICPDGSAVGRSGPNCEFALCPQTSPSSAIFDSEKDKQVLIIESPDINSVISSQLEIKGKIKNSWIFEGVFPIKIFDNNNNLIIQGSAQEIVPGSWTSGEQMIDFTSEIVFSTQAKTGYLILEKDNPSGLPNNSDQIKISLNF